MRIRSTFLVLVGIALSAGMSTAQEASFQVDRLPGGGSVAWVDAYADGSNMYYQWATDYPPNGFDQDRVTAVAGSNASIAIADVIADSQGMAGATTVTDVGVPVYGPNLTANLQGQADAFCLPGNYARGSAWIAGAGGASAQFKVLPNSSGQDASTLNGEITFYSYGSPAVGNAGVGYFSLTAWYNNASVFVTGQNGYVFVSGELPRSSGDPQQISEMLPTIAVNKSYDFSSEASVGYEYEIGVDVEVAPGIPYAIYAECDDGEPISGIDFSLVSTIQALVN